MQNRYSYADWPDLRPDLDGTLINREPERWLYWLVWTNFDCFRAGPHVFWWHGPKECAPDRADGGHARGFRLRGPGRVPRGFECHVVSHWDSWTSLFVGVDDGRLHGIRSGAQTTRKLKRSLVELLREAGHPVADEQDMERLGPTITEEEPAPEWRASAPPG